MIGQTTASYAVLTAPLSSGAWSPLVEAPFLHLESPAPLGRTLNQFFGRTCEAAPPSRITQIATVSDLQQGLDLFARSLTSFPDLSHRIVETLGRDTRRIDLSPLAPAWDSIERFVERNPEPKEAVIVSFLVKRYEQGALWFSAEFIPFVPVGHAIPMGCQVLLNTVLFTNDSQFLMTLETYAVTHEMELEPKIGPESGVERRLRIRRDVLPSMPETAVYRFMPKLPQVDGMIEVIAKGREPGRMRISRAVDERQETTDNSIRILNDDYHLLLGSLGPWIG